MNNEMNDRKADELFYSLVSFLKCMPKNKVKMINLHRYKQLMKTASELKKILAENTEQGEIDIEIDEMFNAGYISARLNDLEVTDTQAFAEMIAKADNFEIYPRTDGTIQLNITLQSALKTIS